MTTEPSTEGDTTTTTEPTATTTDAAPPDTAEQVQTAEQTADAPADTDPGEPEAAPVSAGPYRPFGEPDPDAEPNQGTVVAVRDEDGRTHWSSRTSPFVLNGLRDGTLTEVDDAGTEVRAPGQDPDTDDTDSGPGDGTADGDVDNGDDAGVPGATPDEPARKRRRADS